MNIDGSAVTIEYRLDYRRSSLTAAALLRAVAKEAQRLGSGRDEPFAALVAAALLGSAGRLDVAATKYLKVDDWHEAVGIELISSRAWRAERTRLKGIDESIPETRPLGIPTTVADA